MSFEDERERWLEYTRRKKEFREIGLTCEEYDAALRSLCDELRI